MASFSSPRRHRHALSQLQQIDMDDLVGGTGEFSNLQKVIRMTFKQLIESTNEQQSEIGRLHDYHKHLSQAFNSKLDRTIFEEFLQKEWASKAAGAAAVKDDEIAVLREEIKELRRAQARMERQKVGQGAGYGSNNNPPPHYQNPVQEALERQIDALRAEFAPKLGVGMNGGGDGAGGSLHYLGVGSSSPDTIASLSRRIELLQLELCRVAKAVDTKADEQEVDAALRLRVSKTSFQKRLTGIQEETTELQDSIRRLRSRVEEVENIANQASKEVNEQDAMIRKAVAEAETLKEAGEGEAGKVKNLEGLVHQIGKRAQRTEKEVAALQEKIPKENIEGSLKTFEEEIIEELDTRDENLRRQSDEMATAVQALQSKVQEDESIVEERLDKVESAVRYSAGSSALSRTIIQRLQRLEEQCQEMTPEHIGRVVDDALRGIGEVNRLAEYSQQQEHPRPPLRRECSFKEILHRLDDLDFDMAHAGMLFKVMQEVVCDALGALESDVLWQVGRWVEGNQKEREDVVQRLDRIQTHFHELEKKQGEVLSSFAATASVTDTTLVGGSSNRRPRRSSSHSPTRRTSSISGSQVDGSKSPASTTGHRRLKSSSSTSTSKISLASTKSPSKKTTTAATSPKKKVSPTKKASAKGKGGGERGGAAAAVLEIDSEEWNTLVARVEVLEERVDQASFVAADDKENVESNLMKVEEKVARLKEVVEGRGAGGGEGADNGGPGAEVLSELESRILSCQDQISSRMLALKHRVEHPLEGLKKTVAALSDDMGEIKRHMQMNGDGGERGLSLEISSRLRQVEAGVEAVHGVERRLRKVETGLEHVRKGGGQPCSSSSYLPSEEPPSTSHPYHHHSPSPQHHNEGIDSIGGIRYRAQSSPLPPRPSSAISPLSARRQHPPHSSSFSQPSPSNISSISGWGTHPPPPPPHSSSMNPSAVGTSSPSWLRRREDLAGSNGLRLDRAAEEVYSQGNGGGDGVGNSMHEEQLESIRREKEEIRTRIRAGLHF